MSMMTARAAEVIAAVADSPSGLRLAEISRTIDAPLSSTQRAVASLHQEGILVRSGDGPHPRWRIAPGAPQAALVDVADWKLPVGRASALRQQTAAMTMVSAADPDRSSIMRRAMAEPSTRDQLVKMAERMIWWQSPTVTLRDPDRLIAQVMAIGRNPDVSQVMSLFGEDAMREVLAAVPPGVFGGRAWNYWHLRLGYARVPPLPVRA
jgi:hypothetical protein